MDLVTQGLLGGCVGQLVGQKRLGRRAIIGGALAGILPDADMIVAFSQAPFNVLIYHRGITHSLFFGPVIGPLLALLTFLYYRKRYPQDTFTTWSWVFTLSLVTHPLLDWFTTYGTQLLAPFSHHRFSLNAIGIIDPFYSLSLLLPCLI
jgi:inner membrane protein